MLFHELLFKIHKMSVLLLFFIYISHKEFDYYVSKWYMYTLKCAFSVTKDVLIWM